MSTNGRPSRQRDLKERERGKESSTWDHPDKVGHWGTWMTDISDVIKITIKKQKQQKQQRNISRNKCRLRSTFRFLTVSQPKRLQWLQVRLQPRWRQDYAHAVPPRCGKAAPPDSAHCFCLTATPRQPCRWPSSDLRNRRHKHTAAAAAVWSHCGWSAALTWDCVIVPMWTYARVTPALCGTASAKRRWLFGCRNAAPLLSQTHAHRLMFICNHIRADIYVKHS